MKLEAGEISASSPAWDIRVLDEVASTNDVVRDLGLSGSPHGAVVFAEHQISGRGRRQNRWIAPAAKDLMFSILLKPDAPVPLWPRITTLAALAICKGIEHELPLSPVIKWPNDVYLADRKIAGLLAESLSGPSGMFIVLGIGLNVNTTTFPKRTSARQPPRLHSNCVQTSWRSIATNSPPPSSTPSRMNSSAYDSGFISAMEEIRARSWLIGKTIRATVEGREVFRPCRRPQSRRPPHPRPPRRFQPRPQQRG